MPSEPDVPERAFVPERALHPTEGYDAPDEWVECPHCHSPMTPLREHEVNRSSEFPAVEAELWEFLLWGWMAFAVNFAHGLLTYAGRKRKLAKLKQDVLPGFPRSLVCPRCFYVTRRL